MSNIAPSSGSVQCGSRPVFVISNDANNQHSATVNVFPLTSKVDKRKLPCHVNLINYEKFGLSKPSTIMIEQPMTIPIESLRFRIGKIEDANIINAVVCAMRIQFPLLAH